MGRDSSGCFIVPFRPEISHCFESRAEWNYFQVVSPGVIIFNGVNSLSVSKLARAREYGTLGLNTIPITYGPMENVYTARSKLFPPASRQMYALIYGYTDTPL